MLSSEAYLIFKVMEGLLLKYDVIQFATMSSQIKVNVAANVQLFTSQSNLYLWLVKFPKRVILEGNLYLP